MTRKERTRKLHEDLDYILTCDEISAAAVELVIEGLASAIQTPELHDTLASYLSSRQWIQMENDFHAWKQEAVDRVRRPWLYPYKDEVRRSNDARSGRTRHNV